MEAINGEGEFGATNRFSWGDWGEGRGEHGTVAVGGLHLGTPLMENARKGAAGARGGRWSGRKVEWAPTWKGLDDMVEGAPVDSQCIKAPGVTVPTGHWPA